MFMTLSPIFGQVTVNFGNVNADPNTATAVEVRVTNFTNLVGAQFSVSYNPATVRLDSINGLAFSATDFSFGLPGNGGIQPGQMTVSWFDNNITPRTIPANGLLFRMNFTAIGAPCDSTNINFTGMPTSIEFLNANLQPVNATANVGKIKINGTNCNGGGGPIDGLTFTGNQQFVAPGAEACVSFTVEDFIDMQGGQGSILFNANILRFEEVRNTAFTGFNFNTALANMGQINYLWANQHPQAQPVNLPDGSKLFDVCFTAIGANGTSSEVILEDGQVPMIWTSETEDELPFNTIGGRVNITSNPPTMVTLRISDVTASENSNVCVDVLADNFNDIASLDLTFQWNESILSYTGTSNFNLPGINNSNFNVQMPNRLRLSWNTGNGLGVNYPNNTRLFSICFDVLIPCEQATTSDVIFTNISNSEVINSNAQTVPFVVDNGSVIVRPCGTECQITSKTNVLCNGASTGSIIVSVSGTPSGSTCECVWRRNGVVFQTLPLSNCNLVGAPAGNYTLEVTCGGTVECTLTDAITQPMAINIQETVVNEGCGGLGSITLTVTGGTLPYTYRWSDTGSSTTKDIANLTAGTYTVTVTDGNMCTNTKSIVVTDAAGNLNVTPTVTNVRCFGESNGSIMLNIMGGCGPYTITYTPANGSLNANVISNLPAGVYNITITDSSTPVNTITRMITVGGPTQALSVSVTGTASTGANGTATATIAGGTGPFSTVWTGPTAIPANATTASNLAPGTYGITVTDANGCTATGSVVIASGSSNVTISGTVVISEALYNGFGVGCNGDCTGEFNSNVGGGVAPYVVTLMPGNLSRNIAAAGQFSFAQLCPGTYMIRVTDANGATATSSVTISQPTRLNATPSIICEEGTDENGGISLNITGGTLPYSFSWSNGAVTRDLLNVAAGVYSGTVTDANGCRATLTNVRVGKCSDADCYEGLSIMTPNFDGANDEFTISCVTDFPADLLVYDRWGSLVYQQREYDNTWMGDHTNGTPLVEGAYMWVLTVNFGNGIRDIYRGTVTILRN